MDADEIVSELRSLGRPDCIEGMARYGIKGKIVLGVGATDLKRLAKRIGKDHSLARKLWATGIYDARILASLVDEPAKVTETQMNRWAKDFDSWAVCDTACMYLFDKTGLAYDKVFEWSRREEEFVKRAAFSLMAVLAVHDKKAPDSAFLKMLPVIVRGSTDERNYVKKAVNWALRQIGKRNIQLNAEAIRTAAHIRRMDSRSARWIAGDALRELRSESVRGRLRTRRSRDSARSARLGRT
jgi:3-methyladenine DNA glycosylase AlkD